MQRTTTLVECRIQVAATIEFQHASLVPVGSPPPQLATVKAALDKALEARGRKVIVIGHAGDTEAKTSEARARLAAGRAEVVRSLLIGAGLSGDRLVARPAEVRIPPAPLPAHRGVVSFELDPDRPTPTDVDATARGARRWCDEASSLQGQ